MFRSYRSTSDKNVEWFGSEEYREKYGTKRDSVESKGAKGHEVGRSVPANNLSAQSAESINVAPLIEAVLRDNHCRFSTREVCSMLGLPISTSKADLLKELTRAGAIFDASEIYFFGMPHGDIIFRSRRLNTCSK